VGLRTVDVGNVVSSSDANGIALITQISPIDVVFAVPQDQAGALQQSAAAGTVMTVTALDRTRSATLDTGVFASLDNQVDTTTGTVKAKARFANAALALFPSQFVNVRLQLKTIDNAVLVPVTALRHGNDGDYVYVLNAAERTVSLRPVQRGQATADSIQIASGLKAGEQVITEGADRLKDGASVALPGGGAGGPGGPAGGKKRQRPDGAPRTEGQSGGAASAPAPGSASSAGSAGSAGLANSASPAGPAASSAPPGAADAPPLDATSAPRRHRRASQAEGA
jgi:multidrug efflux system membrane fusion protein